jgi:hypothetical protein
MSGFRLTPLLLQVILIHMMSQEPLGHLVQLHGKPHLELLEVINWPPLVNYSHNSDNRNNIWNADVSFSNEYDYTSIGWRWVYQVIQREKYRNKR